MPLSPRSVAGAITVALLGCLVIACSGVAPRMPSDDKAADKDYGPRLYDPGPAPGPGDDLNELIITKLNLDPNGLLPCLMWTDGLWLDNPTPTVKGLGIYALNGDKGILYRLSGPNYAKVDQKNLGRKVNWLAAVPAALVVTVADANEIWLVDPNTLQVTKKIAFKGQGLVRAACSQPLNFIAATCNRGNDMYCINLQTGDQVKVDTPHKGVGRGDCADPVMSPDGQWLFTNDTGGNILRWVCGGGTFTLMETGPALWSTPHGEITVSSDGMLVTQNAGAGNLGVGPDPGKAHCTRILRVTALKQDHCVLDLGGVTMPVGFDPKANLIYSGNDKTSLMVFTYQGVKQKEYKVGKGDVRQYLVHPDGKKLVLFQTEQVSFVELKR
jgi:hypothetical protein